MRVEEEGDADISDFFIMNNQGMTEDLRVYESILNKHWHVQFLNKFVWMCVCVYIYIYIYIYIYKKKKTICGEIIISIKILD